MILRLVLLSCPLYGPSFIRPFDPKIELPHCHQLTNLIKPERCHTCHTSPFPSPTRNPKQKKGIPWPRSGQ